MGIALRASTTYDGVVYSLHPLGCISFSPQFGAFITFCILASSASLAVDTPSVLPVSPTGESCNGIMLDAMLTEHHHSAPGRCYEGSCGRPMVAQFLWTSCFIFESLAMIHLAVAVVLVMIHLPVAIVLDAVEHNKAVETKLPPTQMDAFRESSPKVLLAPIAEPHPLGADFLPLKIAALGGACIRQFKALVTATQVRRCVSRRSPSLFSETLPPLLSPCCSPSPSLPLTLSHSVSL